MSFNRLIAWAVMLVIGSGGTTLAEEQESLHQIYETISIARGRVSELWLSVNRVRISEQGRAISPPRVISTEEFAFKDKRLFIEVKSPVEDLARRGVTSNSTTKRSSSSEVAESLKGESFVDRRVFDGKKFQILRGGVVEIHSLDSSHIRKNSNFAMFYLSCISWFRLDPTASDEFEKERESLSLPELLMSSQLAFSKREEINDIECIGLSGPLIGREGRMKLWLSAVHGYMCVRWEVTDDNLKLVSSCDNTDPVKVSEGTWIPRSCVFSEYDTNAETLEPLRETRLDLLDWSVHVDESVFAVSYPEKAMIADFGETHRRGLPLDEPLTVFSGSEVEKLDEAISNGSGIRRFRMLGIYVLTAIVAMFLSFLLIRKRAEGGT